MRNILIRTMRNWMFKYVLIYFRRWRYTTAYIEDEDNAREYARKMRLSMPTKEEEIQYFQTLGQNFLFAWRVRMTVYATSRKINNIQDAILNSLIREDEPDEKMGQ